MLRSGQRAIDRLTAQLDQLLAALRLRDPQGVKPMPLQLMRVLQQIAYENEFEALKKGIKLSVIPSSLAIQSDRLLFDAILRNLVRNAVKFTDPGGRILVGCRRDGDAVRIEIRDTGIGIPADEMPRIFDLFTCMGSRPGDSHGVGLYIVRQAIRISRASLGDHDRALARVAILCCRKKGLSETKPIDVGQGRDDEDRNNRSRHRCTCLRAGGLGGRP